MTMIRHPMIRKFAGDRSGNFTIVTAVSTVALMLAAGLALNTAAMLNAKSSMQSALDAALTSTARDITTGTIDEKDARASVERFLSVNQAGGNFAGTITLDKLSIDRSDKTLTGAASIATPVIFPLFGAHAPERLETVASAAYSDKKIEVSLVLDITGSMAGSKLVDLKAAAKNAVALFLDGPSSPDPRVRVALVPYATAVNTGKLDGTVFVEKKGGTDTPPGLNDPQDVSSAPDSCATERKKGSGTMDFSDNGPETAMVNRDDRLGFCPSAALMPLTASKSALDSRIDSFTANGSTAGHIGIQWGRYLLSPKWKNVLSASERPAKYHDKQVSKYAIIMTDGEFNTAYVGTGGAVTSSASAETLCEAMRDDGIEVFTVGFMLKEATAKDTLASCASPDTGRVKHYYDAATGSELKAAFREIASNIEKLAITQ
jgi:Flp pilus assembly protein TadG